MTKTITLALCSALMLTAAPLGANKNKNKAVIALPPEQESVLGGAEYTKAPETWELSYDIAMQPYLEDYKKCLGYGNRIFDGNPNVEAQHRADIPRCLGVREEATEESNAAIARRGRTEDMPPAAVDEAFETIGQIHVLRGRNLDALFQLQMRALEERRIRYEAAVAARKGSLQPEKSEDVDIPNAQD
ncbi:MAG: hypothetical protein AAGA34_15785 [Pseudomonadota bacterium]